MVQGVNLSDTMLRSVNVQLDDVIYDFLITTNEPFATMSFNPTSREVDELFYFYLWNVVAPILFSTFTVVGIAGNSLVAYVIISNVQMRSVTNLLLLNLAFADISCLLVCGPFAVYKYTAPDWNIGNLACQVIQYVLYVTVYVTIYTLVVISAHRYVTIVCGHKPQVYI